MKKEDFIEDGIFSQKTIPNLKDNMPTEYVRGLIENMKHLQDFDKFSTKYDYKLFGNPKGGTGKLMSQQNKIKARKKRKLKSN